MRRPLFFLLIAFIAGIVAGSLFAASYYLLLSVLTLILFLLLVTIRNKWSTAGFFLIISFIFMLGVFDIQKQQYFVNRNQDIGRYIDKGKLTIEGIVIESPLSYSDKHVLIVRCLRAIKDKSYIPVSGNIRLAVPALTDFQYGDFIRFHSTLKRINNFNNPGGFDYEHFLNLQGIYATGFVSDASGIVLLRQNSASPIRLKLESFRRY